MGQTESIFLHHSLVFTWTRTSHLELLSALQALDQRTIQLSADVNTRLDDFSHILHNLLNIQFNASKPDPKLRPNKRGDLTDPELEVFTDKAVNLAKRMKFQRRFLEGLTFDSMKQRHGSIREAHGKKTSGCMRNPKLGLSNG